MTVRCEHSLIYIIASLRYVKIYYLGGFTIACGVWPVSRTCILWNIMRECAVAAGSQHDPSIIKAYVRIDTRRPFV